MRNRWAFRSSRPSWRMREYFTPYGGAAGTTQLLPQAPRRQRHSGQCRSLVGCVRRQVDRQRYHVDHRVAITSVSTNLNYEQFSNRAAPLAGDYLWITSLGDFAFGAWTDWRDTVAGANVRTMADWIRISAAVEFRSRPPANRKNSNREVRP